MKNQYFGDLHDYRKYGLLRCLIGHTGIMLGVVWMLTDEDARNDGEIRHHFDDAARWERFDPELYRKLQQLGSRATRSVRLADSWGLLPAATYHAELLARGIDARDRYFAAAERTLGGSDVWFFDPDNGVEVRSCKRHYRNAPKYVFWSELESTYAAGKSLVVYQHFCRRERRTFTESLVQQARARCAGADVQVYFTPHVLFLVIVQPGHRRALAGLPDVLEQRWAGQVWPLRVDDR